VFTAEKCPRYTRERAAVQEKLQVTREHPGMYRKTPGKSHGGIRGQTTNRNAGKMTNEQTAKETNLNTYIPTSDITTKIT
jgi:hypothetical protein